MDAVGLVEPRVARDAVEQERQQRRAVGPGELGVERAGSGGGSRRRSWAAPPSPPARGAASAALRRAASRIACDVRSASRRGPGRAGRRWPRLDHEHRHRLAQQPVEAAPRAGRGLAAHAGVDDAVAQSRRVDLLLDERGEGLRTDRDRSRPSGWFRGRARPGGSSAASARGRSGRGALGPGPTLARRAARSHAASSEQRQRRRERPREDCRYDAARRRSTPHVDPALGVADPHLPVGRARAHRPQRYHVRARGRSRSSRSPGPRAAARARCSACSRGSTARRAAACCSTATTCLGLGEDERARCAPRASASCSSRST